MANKGIVAALGVCLAISLMNSGVLVYQFAKPIRVMTAKDWLSDKQFKKAVQSIAEGYGYLDEQDVKEMLERCIVRGKIGC